MATKIPLTKFYWAELPYRHVAATLPVTAAPTLTQPFYCPIWKLFLPTYHQGVAVALPLCPPQCKHNPDGRMDPPSPPPPPLSLSHSSYQYSRSSMPSSSTEWSPHLASPPLSVFQHRLGGGTLIAHQASRLSIGWGRRPTLALCLRRGHDSRHMVIPYIRIMDSPLPVPHHCCFEAELLEKVLPMAAIHMGCSYHPYDICCTGGWSTATTATNPPKASNHEWISGMPFLTFFSWSMELTSATCQSAWACWTQIKMVTQLRWHNVILESLINTPISILRFCKSTA